MIHTQTKMATAAQKQLIHIKLPDPEHREAVLSQFINSGMPLSCNSLTFVQARALLSSVGWTGSGQTNVWTKFDIKNRQHKYILSLLRQLGWTKGSDRYGVIADMDRFGDWLQSHRTPVNKPLIRMNPAETTKVINALESMLGKKWNK